MAIRKSLRLLEVIGDSAFCEAALTEIDLTAAERIEKYAFVNNRNLTKVIFGDTGITLGEGAFSYCEKLSEAVNLDKVYEIGDYAFAYTAILSADLTGAVSIGDFAFMKEVMTPFTVILGENLVDIGDNPFAMCVLESFHQVVDVTFNGVDPHPWGNTFIALDKEEVQKNFTDQTWKNSILTFWVYNPNEKPIEFQLRIADSSKGVDMDWSLAPKLEETLQADTGFRITGHSLEFTGLCPDCSEKV